VEQPGVLAWLLRWLKFGDHRPPVGDKENTMCEKYDPRMLLERLKNTLVQMQWRFGEDAERLALVMAYGGRNGMYHCVFQVHPEYPVFAFYTYVQCRVPEGCIGHAHLDSSGRS
jgi:hypothetical protein